MLQRWLKKAVHWVKAYRKQILVYGGGGFVFALIIVQFAYPTNHALPFTSIDGVSFSGWSKSDVTKELDARYEAVPIGLHFGDNDAPYRSPTPAAIGIKVSNEERIASIDYPWYLRFVPTSILWGHVLTGPNKAPANAYDTAVLSAYVITELGEDCRVAPKNATLKVSEGNLVVEKSAIGGTCKTDEVIAALSEVKPTLGTKMRVTIPVEVIPAAVSNGDASALAEAITQHLSSGVLVTAAKTSLTIPKETVISWLDFDTTNDTLEYSLSVDRSRDYLMEKFGAAVSVPAGVSKVTTRDFVETSRQNGANGQGLSIEGTLQNIKKYINKTTETVTVATAVVPPRVEFTRTYSPSDVGLSALMQNFATSHPGTYGSMLIELSGQNRRAEYNSGKSFVAASTYKVFVAYSTLKRIEAGTWKWSDQIQGGRDLAKCFDDMIVRSDNPCAEALLSKIGYSTFTSEMRSAGFTNTGVMSDGTKTSAADLGLLLSLLQTGQILGQQSSRDTLIAAMKRNIYRQGIPSGVGGTVANKVGFINGLLHDAGIVYATTGTYVLVIMTDGSSWANIAELTRQIEALRIQ